VCLADSRIAAGYQVPILMIGQKYTLYAVRNETAGLPDCRPSVQTQPRTNNNLESNRRFEGDGTHVTTS